MNYREFFFRHNIEYQNGLTFEEFTNIEEKYNIVFPNDLRNLLRQVLPISKGFYNWRDFSDKNVDFIFQVLNRPFIDFYDNASEIYWNDEWGIEPNNKDEIERIVRTKLLNAPKLIPVYAHRYIPMINYNTNPVFSIHGIDAIIYGKSLDDYLKREFEEKSPNTIDMSKICTIPFWSEII